MIRKSDRLVSRQQSTSGILVSVYVNFGTKFMKFFTSFLTLELPLAPHCYLVEEQNFQSSRNLCGLERRWWLNLEESVVARAARTLRCNCGLYHRKFCQHYGLCLFLLSVSRHVFCGRDMSILLNCN